MLVQKLRLQRGWSQEQLAELSGLSVRTVQRIERGLPASNETLKSLASVFEIDFSTLQATQEPAMNATIDQTFPSNPPPNANVNVSPDEEAALRHVRKIRGFYGTFGAIRHRHQRFSRFLTSSNHPTIFGSCGQPWVGAWVLLFHGMRVFGKMPFMNADWEKRQVEKYLGRKL